MLIEDKLKKQRLRSALELKIYTLQVITTSELVLRPQRNKWFQEPRKSL